jgi:hypothetical protein
MTKAKKISEHQLIIYAAYTQIFDVLQHYNKMQTAYRGFTSTWLLASFIGIGYALSSLHLSIVIPGLILVFLISLASTSGVFLIWYLDLIVCEKFIATSVSEGLELEEKFDWLPKFYSNIGQLSSYIGYINQKSLFYLGIYLIQFTVINLSACAYTFVSYTQYWPLILALLIFLEILFMSSIILYTKKTDPYSQLKFIKGKTDGI